MQIIEALATTDRALLERAIEARTKVIPVGEHTVLARILGDLLVYVDTHELILSPTLLMNGFWEFWVTQAVARHVKPGMTCIDVGSNVGYYTLLMAALAGASGHVHAFDILPANCRWLTRSAEINGFLRRVQVHHAAVCDHTGDLWIQTPKSTDGYGHLGNAAIRNMPSRLAGGDEYAPSKCSATTLDVALADEARVDFIKIDVEGAEPLVWEGSVAVREKHNPVICMEYEGWREGYPRFLQRLHEEGYRVRFVDYTSELAELPEVPDPERLYMLWVTK